jgi:hypothetical protein
MQGAKKRGSFGGGWGGWGGYGGNGRYGWHTPFGGGHGTYGSKGDSYREDFTPPDSGDFDSYYGWDEDADYPQHYDRVHEETSGARLLQNLRRENLKLNGEVRLSKATITNRLTITGSAEIVYGTINELTGKGTFKITRSNIENINIAGTINAREATFGTVELAGPSAELSRSTIDSIQLKSAKRPRLVLDACTVTGDVSFSEAPGEVILRNGAKILGRVDNAVNDFSSSLKARPAKRAASATEAFEPKDYSAGLEQLLSSGPAVSELSWYQALPQLCSGPANEKLNHYCDEASSLSKSTSSPSFSAQAVSQLLCLELVLHYLGLYKRPASALQISESEPALKQWDTCSAQVYTGVFSKMPMDKKTDAERKATQSAAAQQRAVEIFIASRSVEMDTKPKAVEV